MIEFARPLLGFCAFSGTGKTTLLANLLPLLKESGLHVAVVKHAHHGFEVDQPGKDSYRLRHAGAEQVLVASRARLALIREFPKTHDEPGLQETLSALDPAGLDLILVEGFKREAFPKIELHRPSLGKPLMFPRDANIVAVATDEPLAANLCPPLRLDLNAPRQIADFVIRWTKARSHGTVVSRIHEASRIC